MALDTIIIDGDQVSFIPVFIGAVVIVQPGKIVGSGVTTIKGKKVCVEGDEKNVEIQNCSYIGLPTFLKPGTGTLRIQKLGGDQLTQKIKSGNKAIILKGSLFTAEFEVVSPATELAPPNTPDGAGTYIGKGQLIPVNTKIKAD